MNVADVLRVLALMARTLEELDQHGYEGLKICVVNADEDGGVACSFDDFARDLATAQLAAERARVAAGPDGTGTAGGWLGESLGACVAVPEETLEEWRSDLQAVMNKALRGGLGWKIREVDL
jgi:hypothetical protein